MPIDDAEGIDWLRANGELFRAAMGELTNEPCRSLLANCDHVCEICEARPLNLMTKIIL